jgi:hypothetical protein
MRTNIPPACVIQVEVELVPPTLLVLQVRAAPSLSPMATRMRPGSRALRMATTGWVGHSGCIQEPIPPTLVTVAIGRFENRSVPFFGSVLQPILKLIGDFRQGPAGDPLPLGG